MTIFQLAKKAQDYYESIKSQTISHGFTKFVLTDGEQCLIVSDQYRPVQGETLFKCETRNGNTLIVHVESF